MVRMLAVRQDNNGDVLLTGPALRALASGSSHLTLLCGPRGAAAARLLPGVERVIVSEAAWIDADPEPVSRGAIDAFVNEIARGAYDEATIFTSFHQSPLPAALLLRMAGIARIGAISVDYPGTLLDVRHRVDDGIHEVERALSLANAMGYSAPAGDDKRLRLRALPASPLRGEYVVVHPGCTMAARTWNARGFAAVAERLGAAGICVAVTGAANERALTAAVASVSPSALDFGGATTFAQFAALIAGARVVISGNTAATHVASATGTPVVEIFPPTIPFSRFSPWMVPYRVFGDHAIACAGCRARVCPVAEQPCLREVTPELVAQAALDFAATADVA